MGCTVRRVPTDVGARSTAIATVRARGDEPPGGLDADAARRRGAPAGGMADHVPPRVGGPRPVHQRELLDPAHRDPDPRRPARFGRAGQLRRHGRRGGRQGVPRSARGAVPGVPRSRATGREGARARAAAGLRLHPRRRHGAAAAEGWSAPAWRAVAETVADATAWRTPDIPLLGDPGPFRGSPALG